MDCRECVDKTLSCILCVDAQFLFWFVGRRWFGSGSSAAKYMFNPRPFCFFYTCFCKRSERERKSYNSPYFSIAWYFFPHRILLWGRLRAAPVLVRDMSLCSLCAEDFFFIGQISHSAGSPGSRSSGCLRNWFMIIKMKIISSYHISGGVGGGGGMSDAVNSDKRK